MVEDDVLVWTAVVVSAELIQRTPATAPHTADTRQTPETETTAFSISSITDLDSDTRTALSLCLHDLLGALVQSAYSHAVIEGHIARCDGHMTKHQ